MHLWLCLLYLKVSHNIFVRLNPGPFDSALSTKTALEQVAEHHSQLVALKEEEATILNGLSFFKIEKPHDKSLHTLEKVGQGL